MPSTEPTASGHDLDHLIHAQQAKLTRGIPITAARMASDDWATHRSPNPSEQLASMHKAAALLVKLGSAIPVTGAQDDPPFKAPGWQVWPLNLFSPSPLSCAAFESDGASVV